MDAADAVMLFNQLGLNSVEEAYDILERSYGTRLLTPRHYYLVEGVVKSALNAREKINKTNLNNVGGTKTHINDKGEERPCKAEKRPCKFRDNS